MQFRRVATAFVVVVLAACNVHTEGPVGFGNGQLQLVNGARDAGDVQLYFDGVYEGTLPLGSVAIAPRIGGDHVIEVRRNNGTAGFSYPFTIVGTETLIIVAFDSAGVLRPYLMTDTSTIVPAGTTKLRVGHFAANAGPIDIWRTQPDLTTPTRVMVPFNYLDESPYLQSTPGDWQVLVSDTVPQATPGAPMPDTIGMSAAIPIVNGASRTVLVVDKLPSGILFVVLEP